MPTSPTGTGARHASWRVVLVLVLLLVLFVAAGLGWYPLCAGIASLAR